MELTDQQYEQIQLYIQGKLSDTQLTEMEQLIAQNPDYAQAVADERILLKAIEQDARKTLKNRFDALHTQMDKETVASLPTQRSFFLRYAAAASVVLLLGVGWFLWQYSPTSPTEAPPLANIEPAADTAYQLTPTLKGDKGNMGFTPNIQLNATTIQIAYTDTTAVIRYRYANDTLYLLGNIKAPMLKGITDYNNDDFTAKYLQIEEQYYQLFETTTLSNLRAETDNTILQQLKSK
jgi:hypothetical protein